MSSQGEKEFKWLMCACVTIVSLVFVYEVYNRACTYWTTQEAIKQGYSQRYIEDRYSPIWVKDSE